MDALPIDALLPDIVAALRTGNALVVEAPPGAGKTTRVPRALLDAGMAAQGEIVVLQPRRLPARLGAARVAAELGGAPGGKVGYTVRFEDVTGPETRVRFVTEGILQRRLLSDPTLAGVAVVVLDEFHERHMATDVALALLRRLQRTRRPDLKLCVMSATLDAEPIVEYLGGCPRLRSEGRRFDVDIDHLPLPDDRPLELQVTGAVRRMLRQEPSGDLLVFLPGNNEIRRCEQALSAVAEAGDLLLLPLHGELPLPEQARVVAPSRRRKVILSTNVAETSVTIDGVVGVIDSGLARMAGHSPWTGLPTLGLAKISQASAVQRAGRAGRTRPGTALRLFTRADFEARPGHDIPEIGRSDLTEVVLTLHALGVQGSGDGEAEGQGRGQGDARADSGGSRRGPHDDFDWLTEPPPGALRNATELLRRLGALDGRGTLTEKGRRMLRFPTHPRLGRLLIEGEDRGVPGDAAALAALIAERDIRSRGAHRGSAGAGGPGRGKGSPGARGVDGIDVIALLELFEAAREARFSPDRLRMLGLDPRATGVVEQARRQFANLMRSSPGPVAQTQRQGSPADEQRRAERTRMDRALCRAALAGFSDRVGRRREGGSRTVLMAGGGTAELGYEPDTDYVVALDAQENGGGGAPGRGGAGSGRGAGTVVRLGCGIEPDWLGDLETDDLRMSDLVEFDEATSRVVRRSRMTFQSLVLDETVRPAEAGPEATRVLAEAALSKGAAAFDEPAALATLLARLALLGELDPELPRAALDEAGLRDLLVRACEGLRSFAELRQPGLTTHLLATMPPQVRSRLAADAPLSVTLPGGRSVRVNYQPDQPPWIESRLQDFFGLARGPAVGGGRIPLTLHLLAPNGRAVQVTRDLESFWRQHYPALRRELGRRYPRHSWPDDGRTAVPPPPLPPRRRA